jgi:trk system potassium uptake protein TrkA
VVYFFAAERDVQPVIAAFHMDGHVNRHIIIAGGGNLGARLARLLEPTHQVKIIEHDHARCRYLAGSLHRTLVLNGDATDGTLLEGEGIEATDVFCAATNEDRTNVVAAMLAKRMGARRTLAIVNSASHGLLAEQAALDIALTPAEVTIGALLAHIRRGDVVGVRSLRRGSAEALELIARGDRSTSRAVGRPIRDLALPDSVRIGALLRKEQVILPGADTIIETDDHILLLLADKTQVDAVEAAFRVAITFV